MTQSTVGAVRSWAERNEPFFRLAEVFIVAGFGCYIAWQQTRIANQQLKVSEAELATTQQYARAQYTPTIEFKTSFSDGKTQMACKGDVHLLHVRPTLFIEQRSQAGAVRRVAVLDFYPEWDEATNRLPVFLSERKTASFSLLTRFLGEPNPFDFDWKDSEQAKAATQKVQRLGALIDKVDRRVMCYVEIKYVNPAREQLTESMVVLHPHWEVRTVQSEPIYDAVIHWKDLKGKEEWDLASLHAEIQRLMPIELAKN